MGVLNDIIGQEIAAGKFIAYGVRSGNSGDLKVGQVISCGVTVETGTRSDGGKWESKSYEIKVRGVSKGVYIEEDGKGHWDYEKWELNRPGTLIDPTRVIVLNEEMIPEIVRKLYE